MKKDIRLYNVMFPIWMMFLFPTYLWLIILPVNFLIDSLVIYLSARRQKLENRLELWKKTILPVWIIGFIADLLGAGVCFGIYMLLVQIPHIGNLVLFPATTLISIPGVIVSAILIYFINKRFVFRKLELDPAAIHRLCLHLAIFTAPYTMLIPIYG